MDVRACAMTGHRNITHALERGLEKRLLDVIEELAAERLPLHYHAYIGYMRSSTVLRQRNI